MAAPKLGRPPHQPCVIQQRLGLADQRLEVAGAHTVEILSRQAPIDFGEGKEALWPGLGRLAVLKHAERARGHHFKAGLLGPLVRRVLGPVVQLPPAPQHSPELLTGFELLGFDVPVLRRHQGRSLAISERLSQFPDAESHL